MDMAENTRMTPEWIQRVWQANPCQRLPNGNIIFPARTAFCNILERPKPTKPDEVKAYGSVLLLPDLALIGGPAAIKVLEDAYAALLKEKMPAALQNPDLREKLHNPFKKQGSYINTKSENGDLYEGFVPGRLCISANSSQSQPAAVDQNMAPIVDKSRLYSGCWVIAAVREGWIKNPQNPGPTFYLQSVMVIADDNSLGGVGVSNPSADFGGVKIDAAVNPSAAFGMAGATAGAVEPTAMSLLD